jgi:hypothetical protein
MCRKFFLLISFAMVLGIVVNASGQPTGQIMHEVWENIGGTVVSDLTGNAAYPDNPTYADLLSDFAAPVDVADNFGSRIHGYLYVENSGDYTFWIASDDASELWLSTDDDPANAVLMCSVDGWTSNQDWDGTTGAPGPNQMSAPVTLEAGGKYYISALYKEGGGGDNCSVAWEGPDHPERVLLAGHHLSPAAWALSAQKAKNPVPADGAVDVDTVTLEWTPGALAVSNQVYLNGELIAETSVDEQNFAAATLDPGVTYEWRVDEVQEDGTVIEGDVWTFTTLPLEAHSPSPADAAEDVKSPVTLSWVPGKNTVLNYVYFGTDKALVEARDPNTSLGNTVQTSVSVGDIELFSTYYWAVDEFTPPPGGTVPGPVWSFSAERYVSILTGSETLTYDNSIEPYVSELALDTPADLTFGGIVSDLTLKFQGMAPSLSIDEETGTYQIAGTGADIWTNTDQFHYVYMQLTGDGEISARVVSNGTGSNTWAKGGVMIRESTATDSRHMMMALTGGDGNGIQFAGRAENGGNSSALHGGPVVAPPAYVKLTRTGNDFSAYYSIDGETWELFEAPVDDAGGFGMSNPQTVEMPETVLIGLCVLSHEAGVPRTYTFDNVDIQGDVDGVLVSTDINSAVSGNSAQPIYVALEDVNGMVASVTHPYPAATQITANRPWTIPLSAFEGVDPMAATKLYLGVGNGEPDGKGAVTFSDIKVVEPIPAGGDVTLPGDIVQGVPNQPETDYNDIGWPPAENPSLAIDDNVNTKFLHFAGDIGDSGIRVTPLDGPSAVTGITLTTANDVPGRDPVAYALYGSNESIDGPYELIAEGPIVDFNQPEEWPRFTMNATPITFANQVPYDHYQLIFTAIRGPVGGSVNSMQIAEVELLGEITQPRTLTISSTNGGSVTTPGEASFLYADGAQVELKTKADEYYYFLKWTGSAVDAGKVANPYSANTTVLMDGDYSLKANFASVNFSLTASSTDGGSVIKPGEGKFIIGGNFLIPLKAEADPHYHFLYWTGSAVDAEMLFHPDNPVASVLVIGNYTAVANFAIDTQTLTISSTDGGSVTTPGEGAMVYDYGTVVDLVATPDEHYHFVGWTGTAVDAGKVADPGSASTTVVVEGDYTLIANFEIDTYILTVSSTCGGSVTTPGEGMFEYAYGTVVDLVATPDCGYKFKCWIGPVADEDSACTTVTITEDTTVVATFVKKLCPPVPCPAPEPEVD